MDVKDAQKLKTKLETDILKIVLAFEKETDTVVSCISLDTDKYENFGLHGNNVAHSVVITVEL